MQTMNKLARVDIEMMDCSIAQIAQIAVVALWTGKKKWSARNHHER